jgi:DNA-nicking Smr family endonuclease
LSTIQKSSFSVYFTIMDFGDILNQWENRKKPETNRLKNYIDRYLPDTKNKKEKDLYCQEELPGEAQARRRNLPPQRTLDLHGMRLKEALQAVELFLKQCKKDGIRKVLIIHGKGKHSTEPAILGKKIKEYIQKSPYTGEYGIPAKKDGGSGALWVFIRL